MQTPVVQVQPSPVTDNANPPAPRSRARPGKPRMSMRDFMDSIKHGIYDIFKEDEEYRFPDVEKRATGNDAQ